MCNDSVRGMYLHTIQEYVHTFVLDQVLTNQNLSVCVYFLQVDGELTGAGIDIRCKCVCPHQLINTTKQTVFISVIDDPEDW